MSDPIITELWQIKDEIAREHDCDIEALVAYFHTKNWSNDRRVVDLSACTEDVAQDDSVGPLEADVPPPGP